MRHLVLVAWITSVLLPRPALGQTQAFSEQVDEATLRTLSPVLDAAMRDSLPVAALEAKALEGLVKGYSPAVIVPALERLADDFRLTRDSLRAGLPEREVHGAEVVAASLARGHGVPTGTIAELLTGSAPGSMDIPVTVLGELVRRGVPVGDAAWIIDYVIAEEIAMARVTQIPGRFELASQSAGVGRPALIRALQSLGISPPMSGRPSGAAVPVGRPGA